MLTKQRACGWLALLAATVSACSGGGGTDSGVVDSGVMDSGDPGFDVTNDTTTGPEAGADVSMPPAHIAATQFHYDGQRSGSNRAETHLTIAALQGGGLHRDTNFNPMLDGQVYAQPLYVPQLTIGGAVHDTLFVATQSNTIYALDADTGAQLWMTNLGAPVPLSMLPCGNISTTGVLGTPVIDAASGTLYAVANTTAGGLKYTINALDLATGQQRTGYPAPLSPPMSNGATFRPDTQQQRGALQLVSGRVYIPFGGRWGDCDPYRGWIVAVDAQNPATQTSWATITSEAGIWSPGGPATDSSGAMFAVTGNGSFRTAAGSRVHSNLVFRMGTAASGPTLSTNTTDFFQPSNTNALDSQDVDLGSVAPIVLADQAGSSTPHLLFVVGKAGVGNLLNRDDLGGVANGDGVHMEGVYSDQIFSGGSFGATATWSSATDTYVFVPGHGSRAMPCTGSGGVAALHLQTTGGTTSFSVAWCTAAGTDPSPPTVSSNGDNDAILWTADARAHTVRAYSIADGSMLFMDAPPTVQHWTPPLVVDGRVFITGGAAGGGNPTSSNPPSAIYSYHL